MADLEHRIERRPIDNDLTGSVLVVIPMRGGSLRLPGKHLKSVGGKSLILRAAELVKDIAEAGFIAIVSTDDPLLAESARQAGLNVPFLRPSELATSSASSVDVALHALDWWKNVYGKDPELFVLLQATTPFRDPNHVREAVQHLCNDKTLDAIIGIKKIHRAPCAIFSADDEHNLVALSNERRPATLVTPNGSLYAIRPNVLRSVRTFFPRSLRGIIMGEIQSIDIDTKEDWQIADAVAHAIEGAGP